MEEEESLIDYFNTDFGCVSQDKELRNPSFLAKMQEGGDQASLVSGSLLKH